MLFNLDADHALRGAEPSYRPRPPRPTVHGFGFLHSIWLRRRLVILITALALLPAILYIRLVTPLYTSTSKLLIVRAAGAANGDGKSGISTRPIPQAGMDSLSADELASQREVITSTPVMALALATPGVMDCDPLRNHRDAIEFLKRSLRIETAAPGLMTVSIVSSIPDDASLIVNSVVGAYSQFLSSTRRVGNAEALAALKQSRASAQAELNEKSAALLRFGEENHVGAGDDNSVAGVAELESMLESVNEAHVAAAKAKAANDELNRELSQDPPRAQALKWFEESSPASGSADTDDEELIRRELLALKARQTELEQKFMPGHPSLVRIAQRIEDLNLEHDAAIQRRAVAAARRELDLQHAYDDEQKRILDQAARQAEYARNTAEVADLRKQVSDLDGRIRSIDLAPSSALPTVTVLDPAKASTEPTSPDRRRALLSALGSGFILSCLLACWLERGRSGGVPNAAAGIDNPILAEIPWLPANFAPSEDVRHWLVHGSPVLDDIFDSLGAVLEGARMRGRGVITLVTSPSRADGKSTVASNLAVYLALAHKRVLLIDADLRSPTQAKVFGLEGATGLSTLLEAEVSTPITAINHTIVPSLDVIPSGALPRVPGELLNSQRFIDLLGDLAERYDYVLLDSPPTVTYTDARTMSASADLTLMVVRADQPNRRMFYIASEGLTNIGANLCGVLLNFGHDKEWSSQNLETLKIRGQKEQPSLEFVSKRKFSNLMLAAARAIDLVRLPPEQRQGGKFSSRGSSQTSA